MGDFDIPWIYVAMVAIIFVRWLLGQFKRASAIRERKRKVARRGWDETPPEHSPVYHPKVPFEGVQQPEPARPPQPEPPSQPKTIQELFEMRRREIAEAQRRITPPPVPVRKKEEEKPPPPEVMAPVEAPKLKQWAKASPQKKSQLIEMLSDPGKIRNAIILNEILGKPKGLRL